MDVLHHINHHSQKQHQHLKRFAELDALREQAIEETIQNCQQNKSFSVEAINKITLQINEHAKKGISPTRVYVSEDMILDVVKK